MKCELQLIFRVLGRAWSWCTIVVSKMGQLSPQSVARGLNCMRIGGSRFTSFSNLNLWWDNLEVWKSEVVAWSPANQWPCYPSSGPPTKVPSSNTVIHSPRKLCFGMFWMYTTCYNKRNGASLLPWELRSPEKFYCLAAQLARAWRHNMAMRMQLKDTPTWISFLPGGRCDCLSAPKPTM